jgi:citrate synthase
VVAAGLATQDGPRHGGVAALAYQFLREAMEADLPLQVFSDHLRAGPIPGFGERFYRERDPRAATLLKMLSGMTPPGRLRSTVDELIEATNRRPKLRPTMDFALAVLAHTFGMSPTAGGTIAAIARTAGWIAHALEEYREEPFRFRPRAIYAASGDDCCPVTDPGLLPGFDAVPSETNRRAPQPFIRRSVAVVQGA